MTSNYFWLYILDIQSVIFKIIESDVMLHWQVHKNNW